MLASQLIFWMVLPAGLLAIILFCAIAFLLYKGRCSWSALVVTALPAMLKAFFFLCI